MTSPSNFLVQLITQCCWVLVGVALLLPVAVVAETRDGEKAEVEVMHWWHRSGEARAMRVLRDEFEDRGGIWHDVSGLNSESVLNRAVSRMAKGYAPTLVQWNSAWEIEQIRRLGLLNKADPELNVFLRNSLIENLVDMITVDGEIVAVPVNVHSENWLWYRNNRLQNPPSEIFTNWALFLEEGRKRFNSPTPMQMLAVGDEPWQQRSLFNNVLLGIAGKELYERLYQQLDVSAFDEERFKEAARTFQQLSQYSSSFGDGRWDQQVAAVAGNKALAVVLGDFAKGEFKNLGLRYDKDFKCVPAPGTTNHILLAMDFFVFGQVTTDSEKRGQELFVKVVTDPLTNETFNFLKGSLPPLKDIDAYSLDYCNQLAYTTLNRKGSAIRPYESTGDRGFLAEIDHAISRLWSSEIDIDEWTAGFKSIIAKEKKKRMQTELYFVEGDH